MQPILPFGKHRGQPLSEVPADYLCWLARVGKLSGTLRRAVAAELTRRGIEAPGLETPPPPSCKRCPGVTPAYRWQTDRLGRRHVRAECGRCRRFLGFVPCLPPYVALADAAAGPKALEVAR